MSNKQNNNANTGVNNTKTGAPSYSKSVRNVRRMQKHQNEKQQQRSAENPQDWNNEHFEEEVQQYGQDMLNRVTAKRRPKNTRRRSERPVGMLDEKPSTTSTPARDEPLYEGEATGSHATVNINSHNLDFSGYAVIIQSTYEEMLAKDQRLRRSMPFCKFQHYCIVLLNSVVMKQSILDGNRRFADERDPFDVIDISSLNIPQPIHEYLRGICRTAMQNGDRLHFNLPNAGTPQWQDNEHELPSGTFGVLNADTHNAYECYFSPYISRRLVERTIEAHAQGGNFNAWSPLPIGAIPAGGTFTVNCLGYHLPERLQGEGLNSLAGFNFSDSDDMEGRLSYCPELMRQVSTILSDKAREFVMVEGIQPQNSNSSLLLVSVVHDRVAHTSRLADSPPFTYAAEAFGSSTSNKSKYFQYKRERRNGAVGLCYITANGGGPAGWAATANNNYNMQGEYGALTGVDYPFIRTNRFHEASLSGGVGNSVINWLRRFFHKKRE